MVQVFGYIYGISFVDVELLILFIYLEYLRVPLSISIFLIVSIIQVMDSCMVAYDHTEQRPLFLKLQDKISPTLVSLMDSMSFTYAYCNVQVENLLFFFSVEGKEIFSYKLFTTI